MEAITNFDFFRAIEARATEGMKEAERNMHKKAEEACQKLGLKINEQMPVEGYYHGNVFLERYFRAIKTLMEPKNFSQEPGIQVTRGISGFFKKLWNWFINLF